MAWTGAPVFPGDEPAIGGIFLARGADCQNASGLTESKYSAPDRLEKNLLRSVHLGCLFEISRDGFGACFRDSGEQIRPLNRLKQRLAQRFIITFGNHHAAHTVFDRFWYPA